MPDTVFTRATGAFSNVIVGDFPVAFVTVSGEVFTRVNWGALEMPEVTHSDLTTVRGPDEFSTVIRGELTTFWSTAVLPFDADTLLVTIILAMLLFASTGCSSGETTVDTAAVGAAGGGAGAVDVVSDVGTEEVPTELASTVVCDSAKQAC